MVSFNVDLTLLPNESKLSTNLNNGVYQNGVSFDLEKKLRVASVFKEYKARAIAKGRNRPSITAVAKAAGVSRTTVTKIKKELNESGTVQPPKLHKEAVTTRGVGSRSLSDNDVRVLLELMERNPFRTRRNYCNRLQKLTGTVVSEMTISNFFLKGFLIKGNLRNPDLIPCDKFKPENVEYYFQFVDIIKTIDPRRLKFGDEKLLKGSEVYCKKGRRNVITGEVPTHVVNGDFRNTYAITGFCGIDPECPAVSFDIHDEKNNAASFGNAVIQAIGEGFLRAGDVLVLDNAAIHFKGDNCGLEDWLWDEHRISVLPLPTRSPELNPQELIWRSLTMKIRSTRVSSKSHATAKNAHHILASMTHKSVEATYRELGYIH